MFTCLMPLLAWEGGSTARLQQDQSRYDCWIIIYSRGLWGEKRPLQKKRIILLLTSQSLKFPVGRETGEGSKWKLSMFEKLYACGTLRYGGFHPFLSVIWSEWGNHYCPNSRRLEGDHQDTNHWHHEPALLCSVVSPEGSPWSKDLELCVWHKLGKTKERCFPQLKNHIRTKA